LLEIPFLAKRLATIMKKIPLIETRVCFVQFNGKLVKNRILFGLLTAQYTIKRHDTLIMIQIKHNPHSGENNFKSVNKEIPCL